MTVPKLPTDNLYKFIALFGLTLVVFYIFFNQKNNLEINEESNEIGYEIDLISFEIEKGNKERKLWISQVAELCETKACNCKIKERTDFNISISFDGKNCNSQAITDEILSLMDNIKIDVGEIENKQNIIIAKLNLIKKKKEFYASLKSKLTLMLIFGISITLIGFILWYVKVQKYQDILIKKQIAEFEKEKTTE